MPDMVIHPTLKFVRFLYWVTFLLALAILIYNQNAATRYDWLLIVPALVLIYAVIQRVQMRFTLMTITGDKLRYETGILSKSTRTIQIAKVQDVRVDQSLGQRLLQIGNLSIETAGEASRLTMENIDNPQQVADEIIDAAHGEEQKKDKGKRA